MPYEIMSDHPDCSGFAVVKQGTTEMMGCHKTKADAQKQMAALHAKEPMMKAASVPTDNLVRAITEPVQMRAEGDGLTLYGHFAVFNEWTEINSVREGRFMERIAPSAFDRAIAASQNIRVLYEHGKDPTVGNKLLGTITSLRADERGAAYQVRLYPGLAAEHPLLMDGLRDGAYGASFRFSIVDHAVVRPERSSDYNPERLPERTIIDLDCFEFGPCPFAAYAGATAAVRSMTDEFFDALRDPLFVVRLTERVGPAIVERLIQTASQPTARRDTDQVDDVDPSEVPPTADLDIPESSDDVEDPDSGDRAADSPTEPTHSFTYEERQFHARQIRAQMAGLGK